MTNLEAYFRTYGIKVAQESFDKKVDISLLPYRFTRYSREHFALYGIDRDTIPKDQLFQMGAMTELERWEYFDMKLGIPEHLQGGPKNG